MTSAPPPDGPPRSGTPQWQQPAGHDPRTGVYQGPSGPGTALRPSQAPTRSNRGVIIGILIAVLVIGGGASAWLLSSPTADRSTARGAAEAFVSAVNNRDINAIEQVVCSKDRSAVRNRTGVAGALSQITLRLNSVESSGDRGTAEFTATAIIGDVGSSKAPLKRDRDSGLWTVCIPDSLDN